MNLSDVGVAVLLAIGVLGTAFTSAALLLSKDLYDQLHFLAPGSFIASVAIALAVFIHEGPSQAGIKAVLIAVLLVMSNPVLSHVTARAGRIRRKQQ